MKDFTRTLQNQCAGKPVLFSLIASFNAAIDPTTNIKNFLQFIWNVNTAVGNGLNIWGKIVGVPRTIPSTPPITLEDPDYRTLILVKAAANIGNVTIPTLNRLLRQIFAGSGLVFVQDNLNMSLTYVFVFQPTATQLAIIQSSGAMPRPAGVQINFSFQTATAFGPLNTVRLNTTPLDSYNPQGTF
jgi:hypothetical protein